MAEASSRHFSYLSAKRSNYRRYDKRGFIPDTAGTVLIGGQIAKSGKVNPIPRISHTFGQTHRFVIGHPPEIYRHHQRRCLIIGNFAICITVNEKGDFLI